MIVSAKAYLKAHQPDLQITDPYELTQPQFDAYLAQQYEDYGRTIAAANIAAQ